MTRVRARRYVVVRGDLGIASRTGLAEEGAETDLRSSLWVVPAERAIAVQAASIEPMPDPAPDVVGLHHHEGQPPVPATSLLAARGDKVLVVESDGVRMALIVVDVLRVAALGDPEPRPPGQRRPFIGGSMAIGDETALLLDVGIAIEEVVGL